MKTIITYQCEICKALFEGESDAQSCEDRGIPTLEPYEIGTIYADHTDGAMYSNMTFAIAKINILEHARYILAWACRDGNYADSESLESTCGGDNSLDESQSLINPEHPTFKRMVDFLNKHEIPITVWDGTKPISLEEFLKCHKT